jgi:ankyrin repeat protein
VLTSALANNTSLKRLNLSKNDIRLGGIRALASFLPENTSLRTLNLSSNPIQHLVFEELASALELNLTLLELNLLITNQLSHVDIDDLDPETIDGVYRHITKPRISIEKCIRRNREGIAPLAKNYCDRGEQAITDKHYIQAMMYFRQGLFWLREDHPLALRCKTGYEDALACFQHCNFPLVFPSDFKSAIFLLEAYQTVTTDDISQIERVVTAVNNVLYEITNGYTVLHLAAWTGHTALIKQLIPQGENIAAIHKATGQTPLHLAIQVRPTSSATCSSSNNLNSNKMHC